MVDIAKEVGTELWGGFVGGVMFILLTVAGDPSAMSLEYYLTKVMDLAFSVAAALMSFLIVHIAKKKAEEKKDNRLKRFIKWVSSLLNS